MQQHAGTKWIFEVQDRRCRKPVRPRHLSVSRPFRNGVSAATRLTIGLTVAIRIHVSAMVGSRPLKEPPWRLLITLLAEGAAPHAASRARKINSAELRSYS